MRTLRIAVPIALAAALTWAPLGAQQLDGYGLIGGINRATMSGGFTDLVKDVGGVIDPRSGEILKGHVNLGSLRIRQDRLLFGLIQQPSHESSRINEHPRVTTTRQSTG